MSTLATATREITIAHSPDSDDAFMFYGLATNKVQIPGLRFSHTLCDIQSLNQKAMQGEEGVYDVTAVSFHAYPYIQDRYALMTCGGSVGEGYGPMIVATKAISTSEIKQKMIAVPGKLTTAYLALQLFAPGIESEVLPFDQIIPSVLSGKYEAGLIIHEGQLTYDRSGLHRIVDRWKRNPPQPRTRTDRQRLYRFAPQHSVRARSSRTSSCLCHAIRARPRSADGRQVRRDVCE